MTSNPKIVYTYQPTRAGLVAVNEAIAKNKGLGEAFNDHLKNKEISRTIYR